MDKFGFIVHTVGINEFKKFWGLPGFIPGFLIKFFLKIIPPFKLSEVKQFTAKPGREIKGYFIGCPLIPEQMVKLSEKFVLKRIIQSAKIAERLGAKIVGLGGYTSIVGDKGSSVAGSVNIAVTSGNCLTAWSATEAVLSIAEKQKIDLRKSTLAIIGASGSIGSLCARRLSGNFAKVIITARRKERLEELRQEVLNSNKTDIVIFDDIHQAIKNADVIIVTTSAPEALIDLNELKKGAIICDISIPKNITETSKRNDIISFAGGLIKLPFEVDFGTKTGLPKGVIYGCIAETMLLTMEGNFINYSIGDKISLDKLDEIGNIANAYGFKPYLGEKNG
jgi:predicted amino acid dehydrogenase